MLLRRFKSKVISVLVVLMVILIVFLMGLILSLVYGCTNPMVGYVEARYPNCQVVKLDEQRSGDMVEVTLQCGPTLKIVKMRSNR